MDFFVYSRDAAGTEALREAWMRQTLERALPEWIRQWRGGLAPVPAVVHVATGTNHELSAAARRVTHENERIGRNARGIERVGLRGSIKAGGDGHGRAT